jgi:hypothetical protein
MVDEPRRWVALRSEYARNACARLAPRWARHRHDPGAVRPGSANVGRSIRRSECSCRISGNAPRRRTPRLRGLRGACRQLFVGDGGAFDGATDEIAVQSAGKVAAIEVVGLFTK